MKISGDQVDVASADPIPVVIVCNKIDQLPTSEKALVVRRICKRNNEEVRPTTTRSTRDRIYELALVKGCSYVETSAKTGENIIEAFYIALEHIEIQCGGRGSELTKRRTRQRQRSPKAEPPSKKSSGCTMT